MAEVIETMEATTSNFTSSFLYLTTIGAAFALYDYCKNCEC